MTFRLQRRSFLRGAGGAALALPALEAMLPAGRASAGGGTPRRFVMMYGGMSLVSDGNPNDIVPDTVGANYDLKRALTPLGAEALPTNPGFGGTGHDVQDHVSIVSGLKIPWDTGSGIPAGGRSPEFHYNSVGPQTSGMRGGPGRKEPANGATADQIVADAIAGPTLHPSLSWRIQPANYVGSNSTGGSAGRISYRVGDDGDVESVGITHSPAVWYSSLFGGFEPPDPADLAGAQQRIARHQSSVDLVREHTAALLPKLGQADRIRMEKHLDEVQSLYHRISQIAPEGGDCGAPPDPGDDPPIEGSAIEYMGAGGDGTGYSDEEERANLMSDFLSLAFACDLSRVAAVRFTFTQTRLRLPFAGHEGDTHSAIGHSNNPVGYADSLGFHVKHFARLVARLRDTLDFDGTSLLDNTAIVLMFEGGWGYDPESDTDGLRAHSTENMVALVGGHAGGLNASGGQHIVATDKHPANAVVSAMNAVGVAEEDETLGEVTGRIDGLFS